MPPSPNIAAGRQAVTSCAIEECPITDRPAGLSACGVPRNVPLVDNLFPREHLVGIGHDEEVWRDGGPDGIIVSSPSGLPDHERPHLEERYVVADAGDGGFVEYGQFQEHSVGHGRVERLRVGEP